MLPALSKTAFFIRIVEFILLCLVLPTIIIVYRFAPHMFLFLWGAAAFCWIIYRLNYFESFKKLWKWDAVTWKNMKPILVRWVICSCGMLAIIYFYDPEKVFYMVKHRPHIIPILMVAYPVLSALPQEFIFCSYFFERFRPFFKSDQVMILASAVVFAYAHVLYINPIAPILSFIGGYIFAKTYAQHRSLALVTIEHGLYGNSLFLVGLGWYFWGGAVALAQ